MHANTGSANSLNAIFQSIVLQQMHKNERERNQSPSRLQNRTAELFHRSRGGSSLRLAAAVHFMPDFPG